MNVGKIFLIELTETTAYLAGVILGDGYIHGGFKGRKAPNSRNYRISIDLTDFEFISIVAALMRNVVSTSAIIRQKKVPQGHMTTWSFAVTNKSLWYFFTKTLSVPAGKKSRVVTIPELILAGSDSIKKAFLAGLFDADGGMRSNCIGLTTASKSMGEQVTILFRELGFGCSISSWVIKKYDWRYYGLRLRTREIDRFLKEIPLRNLRKKVAIFDRFIARTYRSGLTGQRVLVKS